MLKFKRYRHVYVIHELTENKFQLCRVLNDYPTEEEATDAVKNLLTKKITEKDLLKKLSE